MQQPHQDKPEDKVEESNEPKIALAAFA